MFGLTIIWIIRYLRIKKQTHYLESLVLFKEVDTDEDTSIFDDGYYKSDVTATEQRPRIDMFKFESRMIIINDAINVFYFAI